MTTGQPWWRTIDLDAFRDRLEAFNLDELGALQLEIKAAVARTSNDIKVRTGERRQRAEFALARLTERRNIVSATMQLRGAERRARGAERRIRRRELAVRARNALERGDATASLRAIVDWLDEFDRDD